jgi:GTP-binding protein Era
MRSGFVTVLGKPNAGKSTLVNTLLDSKIAIVSSKPETTRDNIQGILTTEKAQVIFIDTPGIHRPHMLLGKLMVRRAESSIDGADIIIFLTELTSGLQDADYQILETIKRSKIPVILAINKIDAVSKSRLLPFIDQIKDMHEFLDIIPISAIQGDNIPLLLSRVSERLPEGPEFYARTQITDKDEVFQASEIIREKVLELTRQEVPHSVAVNIESFQKRKHKNILDIEATIYVERDSQRGIIVGKKGLMMKEIGTLSRKELELLFNIKVFLKLWVKVLKNWRKDPISLKKLGMQ